MVKKDLTNSLYKQIEYWKASLYVSRNDLERAISEETKRKIANNITYEQGRVKYFQDLLEKCQKTTESNNESPNDIFCPNCEEYQKNFVEDTSNPMFSVIKKCIKCNKEIVIN